VPNFQRALQQRPNAKGQNLLSWNRSRRSTEEVGVPWRTGKNYEIKDEDFFAPFRCRAFSRASSRIRCNSKRVALARAGREKCLRGHAAKN
jgi:hypothetical protein